MPASLRAAGLIALALLLGACSSPQPIILVATNTPAPPTATPRPTLTPSPTIPPYRDTIVIGLSREPDTLHPLIADEAALHILDAIYEPYLTTLDFAYQPNPNGGLLAELPTLENGGAALDDGGTPEDPVDDQLIVTFRMLPGPAWCDGAPVTAADSAFAFELARDPDSDAASRDKTDRVESYTALDENTIQVRLMPGVLDPAYASYFWTPLPAHIWERYSAQELQGAAESTRRLCGYGPYTIAGAEDSGAVWVAGQSITLAANPHYFRGRPAAQRLVFRFVAISDRLLAQALAGELDIVTADGLPATNLPEYAALARDGKIQLAVTRSAAWEQLLFNLYAPTNFDSAQRDAPHPILGDARVRRAIAHAIDRQGIIDEVYAGQATILNEPLVYPNHPLYTPDDRLTVYEYNPARAASLLEEAGWVDSDGDGVRECQGCTSGAEQGARLALTYRATASTLRDAVVRRVERDLDAVGFAITVELLPRDVFLGDTTGLVVADFEIGQWSDLTAIVPGGERRYGCDWIPAPDNGWYGENYSGWCNPAASRALIQAESSLLFEDRRSAYAAFQREFTRDLPGLPLFPRVDVTMASPRLENLKANDSMPSITWNAFELRVRTQ